MQETIDYIKQAFELKNQASYKQAIEMLYKALELEPENTEIFFQLGELYFLLKNFERSKHYLDKVISANEGHIEALSVLAKIYEYSNDYSNALQNVQKIYDAQKNKKNLLRLIDILSKKGDVKRLKEFEDSDDEDVLCAIAKAYYDNKIHEKSQEILSKIMSVNSQNTDALLLLGKIYFDRSEFDKSKEIFSKFSSNSDNPEILNYSGLFALEDMRFEDAVKYFSKASSLDKKNPKYFYNLGNAYFYNGWIKEAVSSYMQAIRLDCENLDYRYSLAYLYYEIKNFDKAQKEIDYILEINPQHWQSHVINALLKLNNKDYLGAKSELEMNIKSGFSDNFTLISLSDVYRELQMYDKSQNMIEKVIKNNPESLNYKCKLAEILIYQKKFDESLDIINSIIEKDENYIKAYIIGAQAAFNKGDLDKTKEFAQTAISLDINYAKGYYWLAVVRFEEKDFDEAIECMRRAISYDVDNSDYYAFMSRIYETKKDYSAALEYIKEAESISGDTQYRIAVKRLAGLKKKADLATCLSRSTRANPLLAV